SSGATRASRSTSEPGRASPCGRSRSRWSVFPGSRSPSNPTRPFSGRPMSPTSAPTSPGSGAWDTRRPSRSSGRSRTRSSTGASSGPVEREPPGNPGTRRVDGERYILKDRAPLSAPMTDNEAQRVPKSFHEAGLPPPDSPGGFAVLFAIILGASYLLLLVGAYSALSAQAGWFVPLNLVLAVVVSFFLVSMIGSDRAR